MIGVLLPPLFIVFLLIALTVVLGKATPIT